MFYDIVNNLCKTHKTTITRMAVDIGLSNAAPTSWRKGAVPKLGTLEKISQYFNVPVGYLLGTEEKEKSPSERTNVPSPKGNVIKIAGRDGSYEERILTDSQIKALRAILDQMPDASDDL